MYTQYAREVLAPCQLNYQTDDKWMHRKRLYGACDEGITQAVVEHVGLTEVVGLLTALKRHNATKKWITRSMLLELC